MMFRDILSRLTGPTASVRPDPATQYQTLEGWGTSLAWWGHALGGWSEPARSALADLIFGPNEGLGLNIVRYNVGGGDDPSHAHMRLGGDVPGFQPAPGVWDWSADTNQRWMLTAAHERGATIFEAFSNSPPHWMTRSGCAAGAEDGGDNLRDDHIDLFAAYLAEVVAHARDEWGIVFRTVEPFNEPTASNWRRGNRQEGCHVSHAQQNAVIVRLGAQLGARGLHGTAIAASDEYSLDQAADTAGAYDAAALALIAQINVHSYSGTRGADLRAFAASHGKRLWMSEYGTGVGEHDHNAMAPALQLSAQIRRDMAGLRPSAWIYWQAVEHEYDHNHNWGFIHADFSGASEGYWLTKQYYAMGQYSRFIRPGYRIVGVDDLRALAALDLAGGRLVLVYENAGPEMRLVVDLTAIGHTGSIEAYRTSPSENLAPVTGLRVSTTLLADRLPAQSITTYVLAMR